MIAWFTKFGPSLLAFFTKAISSIGYVIAYVMGRRAARAAQREKDLEAQKEYARIAAEHRSANDASDRMRDGDF